MRVLVKLKKEVEFEELLKYGFRYNHVEDSFDRPYQYLSKDVVFVLFINCSTREVAYSLYNTQDKNEDAPDELNAKVIPSALVSISHLLEVVEVENYESINN